MRRLCREDYYADENGNVYSPIQKLKPTLHHTGYLVVSICGKQERVHRFVWEYFNGQILDDKLIDHINHIKTDNRLCNLRLVTSKENTNNAIDFKGSWNLKGEEVKTAKITNEQFFEMVRDFKNNMTNTEIGNKYGLHSRYVSLIRHRRRWRHLWNQIMGSETISSESTSQAIGDGSA